MVVFRDTLYNGLKQKNVQSLTFPLSQRKGVVNVLFKFYVCILDSFLKWFGDRRVKSIQRRRFSGRYILNSVGHLFV